VRKRYLKTLFLYLIVLISLQALGILYFLHEPSIYKGIPLAIFLGTILPVVLALIFVKFMEFT